MKRYPYDLSHLVYSTGKIGYLKPLDWMHVNAGESMSYGLEGTLKMAPLRAPLTVDPHVHLALFFVKDRDVYNWQETGVKDDWEQFIEAGWTGGVTLDTVSAGVSIHPWKYIPKSPDDGSLPAFLQRGIANIWKWWYRIKNYTTELNPNGAADGYINLDRIGSQNEYVDNQWGWITARLPEFWNTGLDATMYNAQSFAEIPASGGAGAINLLDIASVQGEYQSEIMRDWFDKTYGDLLQAGWGSNGVSSDAERRPELLQMTQGYLSGSNVQVTGAGGQRDVGEAVGISESTIGISIPPRFFSESGTIWCVSVVRFPAMLEEQEDYLSNHTLTYDNFAMDPRMVPNMPPEELTRQDFIGDAAANESWGFHPFAQNQRVGINAIDANLHGVSGYPFVQTGNISSTNAIERFYDNGTGADNYFTGTAIWSTGHWLLSANANCSAKRIVAPATESIYAGAH